LSVRTGDVYSAQRVTQSQRRLSALEVFQFTNIDARPPEGQPIEVPVRVTVAEDKLRRLQLGIGYGTEERVRGSVEWAHLNFLGDARQASIQAEWSSIQRLVQLGFTEPYFLRRGLSLESRLSSRWIGERIYTAANYGGRVGVVQRFASRERGATRMPGDRLSVTYIYEFLRHDVRPDVRVDLTNPEELLALGFDPVTGHGRGTRAAIAGDYERVAVDSIANPRLGYSAAAHVEAAGPAFGGTYQYQEVRGEVKGYVPLGSTVVAARLSAGRIAARSDAEVPFSQRYFLGGASTLRGWGRYQVAPLVEGVPVGGLTKTDLSVEWRVPIAGAVGVVGFLDAGKVESRGVATSTPLLSSAGLGLRYQTPVGLVRGDAAVQLRSFEGLNPDRATGRSRPWRLHIGIGHAF
jgi:outer membrane protein insertion porin family/translocation and assembly module TamA